MGLGCFRSITYVTLITWTLLSVSTRAEDSPLVAKIGNTRVTLKDFQQFMKMTQPHMYANTPMEAWIPYLEDYVAMQLVVDEARRMKLHQEAFFKYQTDSLLYQTFITKKVDPDVISLPIAEKDIRVFYEENPLVKTRQILWKLSPEPSVEEWLKLKQRASEVQQEIKAGKITFEAAAQKYSEDYTRDVGGLMPEGGRFHLVEPYYVAALKLKPNELSEPVESVFGVHVVQLIAILPYNRITTSYKREIENFLRRNAGNKRLQDIVATLRKKARAQTFPAILTKALKEKP